MEAGRKVACSSKTEDAVLRESGDGLLGSLPWGTHLCLFYESKQDLLDILVPYFALGLKNNEFCLWITSAPLEPMAAERALRDAVPDLEERKRRGQIEFLRHDQWYTRSGRFDADAALNRGGEKEAWALANGYEGLRAAGDTSWLEDEDWGAFLDYERAVDSSIGERRMLAICTYSLAKFALPDIIEALDAHEFALVRTRGAWHEVTGGRGKMQTTLRECETFRRMVFAQARDAILILELPSDGPPIIRDANAEALRLHGYSYGELIGKPISFLDAEEDPRPLIAARRRLLGGAEGALFEARHRRKDGSVFIAEASVREMTVGGKRLAIDVSRDIHERKQAEEALRTYKEALENSADAIGMSTPQGRHYYQNKAFDQLFGSAVEYPPDTVFADKKVGDEVFRTIMAGGQWIGEVKMRGKDGRILDISLQAYANKDENGAIMSLVGIHSDITERKRAEDALHKSEEQFRSLFESSRDALMTLAPPSWNFTSANPATVAMFRAKGAAEFTSDGPWAFSPERQPDGRASADKASEMIEAAMREGSNSFEWTHKRFDGEEFPTDVLLTRLESGGKMSLQATVRDLTERKRAEDEREKLQARLLHSQKVEVVGRLAGGVAHDFNNLLTVILGNCSFLLNDIPKSDPRRADVEQIRSTGERAANLTRQLLAFGRKQIMQPKLLDLNAGLMDMEKLLRRLIGENVGLTVCCAKGLALVKADPGQMEQVVMNLAINARDAMPKGGRLSIGTSNVDIADIHPLDHDAAMPPGRYALITVSDTGTGMDAGALEHIFEPFFTTKGLGRGTGLGLATIYGIVKQSCGFIDVKSETGRGTTFKIFLPAVSDMPLEGEGEGEGEGKRHEVKSLYAILLVEDEPAVLSMTRRMLEGAGYAVLEARSAREALAYADKDFDLVLTDIVLPDASGVDLVAKLKKGRPIEAVYMSGYSDNPDIRDILSRPGSRFLQKPFTAMALINKIQEALARGPEPPFSRQRAGV